jgi:hypothetical protein
MSVLGVRVCRIDNIGDTAEMHDRPEECEFLILNEESPMKR